MLANRVFSRLMHFYTHLLHLLQPSVLWLSIVIFMMQSHRQSEFCVNLMYHESDRRLEGSLHLSCKRDQNEMTDYIYGQAGHPNKVGNYHTNLPPPPRPPTPCIHAAFQTWFLVSPLFHLVQFAKSWQSSFFGVKFQRSLSKFRERNKNRCLMFRYSIEREIRTLHVVVVQRYGK